jgi:hypothetical protein
MSGGATIDACFERAPGVKASPVKVGRCGARQNTRHGEKPKRPGPAANSGPDD